MPPLFPGAHCKDLSLSNIRRIFHVKTLQKNTRTKIILSSLLSKDYFGVQTANRIREAGDDVQGTRIGMQNVEKMMEALNFSS